MNAHTRRPRRAFLVAALAAVWCAVAASLPAAAPVYTGWSPPVNLGATINSPSRDTGPALSWDGLSLYFDSDRPGGLGGRDFWVSQRASVNDPWGPPVNLGPTVNSPLVDAQPSFSHDGHWMFFTSTRAGGLGGNDVYQSYRADVHDDFAWEAPTNLGPNVNTALGDFAAAYLESEDGVPQLIFNSDRLQVGNADWYTTELQPDGTWGPATPVPELSSPFNEGRATVRRDGLELYLHRGIALGLSATDLWVSTRATRDAPWSPPVNVGAPVNSDRTDQDPYLSADRKTLFFDSSRLEGSGGFDIYMSIREQVLPETKDECKHGGWETFGVFENQGDCVSFVATDGRNQPGG